MKKTNMIKNMPLVSDMERDKMVTEDGIIVHVLRKELFFWLYTCWQVKLMPFKSWMM